MMMMMIIIIIIISQRKYYVIAKMYEVSKFSAVTLAFLNNDVCFA
jgi:hypothetical protein